MTENKQLLKATGIISVGTFTSRIFGVIRDMVIAAVFGAGMTTDAFFIAFKIPNLLRRLLGEGALSAAFIPLFTDYYTNKSKEDAWKLANAVLSALAVVLVGLIIVGYIFMPWVITLLAPGFKKNIEKFDLAVSLTRITFPYIFFISISGIFMGVLNSLRKFVATSFSPVILNFSLIFAALVIAPKMSQPISGLAIGVIIGGVLQLSIFIWAILKSGMKIELDFSFSHEGIKKVGLLMTPSVLALGVTQINFFVDTLIASMLDEGSISYLYYADRVVQLPLGVFATAIGTAILPTLSTQAAKKNFDEMGDTVSFGLRFALFITIPAMVSLIVLASPIVALLFERGNFGHMATVKTSQALLAMSIGLAAFSVVKILSPVYFSLKDTKTPVKIAIAAMFLNIVLNLILMYPMKHVGIALSTSISAVFNAVLLIYFIRGKIGGLNFRDVYRSIVKISASSLVMGAICYCFLIWGLPHFHGTKLQAVALGFCIVVGILIYFFSAYAFKCQELFFLIDIVKKRIRKK